VSSRVCGRGRYDNAEIGAGAVSVPAAAVADGAAGDGRLQGGDERAYGVVRTEQADVDGDGYGRRNRGLGGHRFFLSPVFSRGGAEAFIFIPPRSGAGQDG
jgi:hypothetical protein